MHRIGIMGIWVVITIMASIFGNCLGSAAAEDWQMLGHDGTRNSVSPERGGPMAWSVEQREVDKILRESRGIRWSAALGSETFSSPVVANGLVWIGTNNNQPGVEVANEYHSVLKCFREADGKQVYEYVSPKLGTRIQDAGWTGLGSSPLIEGERLWLTTNRSEVLCWDIGPLIRGEGIPVELWKLDLIKTFDTFPHVPLMGPSRPCSIGASWNDRIFVTTNNGVDQDPSRVPKPDGANLVCLNKETGEVYWKDSSPGSNILMTQLASPTVAAIQGEVQVIVPQSDGWVRAFDPMTGTKLWEFDVNPKESVYSWGRSNRNFVPGNAVVCEDRVYIAVGVDLEHGEGPGRLICIDPAKRGDVSAELAVAADGKILPRRRLQAVDVKAGEKAIPNPNSALVWEFVRCGNTLEDEMHRTISSVSVAKGLVIATDLFGIVHCLDAKTGQRHWSFDIIAAIQASPLIVDDKIYVVDEDGDVAVFGLSADPNGAMRKVNGELQPLAEIPMDNSIYSSPVFANGVLYVAQRNRLFAISGDQVDLKGSDPLLPVINGKNTGNLASAAGMKGSDPFKSVGNWPQWRGPNRDNVSTDTGLLKEWPKNGPPLQWRVSGLGEGISPVSIAGGRVFALCNYDGTEYVRGMEERSGEPLWTSVLGAAPKQHPMMRWLTQRPVTLDGERLYAMSLLGELVCLRAGDGEELWRRNYLKDFSGEHGIFGFSDCPVVDGDKLLCSPGGANSTVVALDTRTGEVVWTCAVPNAGKAAYGNGIVVTVDSHRQFVASFEKVVVGVATDSGQLLWRIDGVAETFRHPHTPLVQDRFVTIVNGFGVDLKRLELKGGNGAFAVNEVYTTNTTSHVSQHQDDTLVVGDRVYEPSNGVFSCLDASTGAVVWRKRMGPIATMTFADGRFYFHSDGLMSLVETTATEAIHTSEFALPNSQPSLGTTTPIVTGGRLYVREDDNLYCYDVRAESLAEPVAEPRVIALAEPRSKPEEEHRERTLRSVFVPTPQDIVEKMLELAAVKKSDVVCDLGSGDGRIVITAAKTYGCKAIGYELDKELVEQSRSAANAAGVNSLVTFERKDLFTVDLTNIDVLAIYLLPQQLEKLLPQLEKMKPGSRVVSHQFEIPGVKADSVVETASIEDGARHTVYLWTLPLKKVNE
ncbi:MAG: PQQ-binding-like beta-propeller repeat protein [Planctomycetaceae bacterium]